MPHADSAFIPSHITSKADFWQHVHDQLASLLDGQRAWVTNLANASSLIYNSLLSFTAHFGDGEQMVNWCGFYIDSELFPAPSYSSATPKKPQDCVLLLGPFCGKPACQLINYAPKKARGVCADAYLQRRALLVPNVDEYPGHIACDGETKSEVVIPLVARWTEQAPGQEGRRTTERALGVLDLDCLALGGFDEDDRAGLERIAQLVIDACDW